MQGRGISLIAGGAVLLISLGQADADAHSSSEPRFSATSCKILERAVDRLQRRCPAPDTAVAAISFKNKVVDCLSDSSGGIYCRMRTGDNNKRIDLESDLFDPLIELGANIDDDTRLAIQAYGGKGGRGVLFESGATFAGGAPGYAETTTTLGDIRDLYGTTILSFLVGKDGQNGCCTDIFHNHFPGSGGSGSIIYIGKPDDGPKPTTIEESCAAVLVIAGGGGGGNVNCTGGCAGPSYDAIADTSGDASNPGARDNGCGGKGGGADHIGQTRFSNSSSSSSLIKYVGDWGRGNSGNARSQGGGGGGFFGGHAGAGNHQGGGSFAVQATAELIPNIRQVQQAEIFMYLEQVP